MANRFDDAMERRAQREADFWMQRNEDLEKLAAALIDHVVCFRDDLDNQVLPTLIIATVHGWAVHRLGCVTRDPMGDVARERRQEAEATGHAVYT